MTLTLSILLERVLNGDGLIHQELSIHRFDGCVSGFKICVRHKSVTLGLACLWITRDLIDWVSDMWTGRVAAPAADRIAHLGSCRHHPKCAKRIIEQTFVYVFV